MKTLRRPTKQPASPGKTAGNRRLPLLLRRAWYGLNQAFRRRIAHLGLTPDQFTVLRTLTENPGLTQSELTRQMSSDPNTVTSLVCRMERAGLLKRPRHATDGRARQLELAADGQAKFRAARRHAQTLQRDMLAVLPAAQQEQFLEQLAAVSEACRLAVEARPGGRAPRRASSSDHPSGP